MITLAELRAASGKCYRDLQEMLEAAGVQVAEPDDNYTQCAYIESAALRAVGLTARELHEHRHRIERMGLSQSWQPILGVPRD